MIFRQQEKSGGTVAGQTKIATIKPTALLGLFPNPELTPVAREVEGVVIRIMKDLA